MRIELQRVRYIPKELKAGVLYVAEEFGAAAHLCPCGCGCKVRTPLGPAEWTLEVTDLGPSLRPSIGNWQYPCRSHYWIAQGQVLWSKDWTTEQVAAGRRAEEDRRQVYFNRLDQRHTVSLVKRVWRWIKSRFRR